LRVDGDASSPVQTYNNGENYDKQQSFYAMAGMANANSGTANYGSSGNSRPQSAVTANTGIPNNYNGSGGGSGIGNGGNPLARNTLQQKNQL
jgi:hypothetical protein